METRPPIPLAVLVGIQLPEVDDAAHEASLDELRRLVKTLGYEVAGTVSQRREGTGAGSLLGSGKLSELAALTGGTGLVGSMAPPPRSKARQRFEGAADAAPAAELDADTLGDVERRLAGVSDALARRYFLQGAEPLRTSELTLA